MRTLHIEGDMDASAMGDMKSLFEEIAQSDEDVRLDMRNVDFIDSSGIGGLVFLFKRLKMAARRLEIINLDGQPKRLFLQLNLAFLLSDQKTESTA
jgi:anti-sigma B factor antagonist